MGSGGTEANTVEASRRHRYLITLMDPLTRVLLFYAHKVTIPAMEIDRIVMHHGQDEIYLPGKNRWSTLEISFYRAHDTNGDMAARDIRKWMGTTLINLAQSKINASGGGASIPTDGGQTIITQSGGPDKRTCEIQVLDGFGDPVYVYKIYGVWPQKSTPDPMDFTDSAIADITVIFQVDKVEEIPVASVVRETKACDESIGGLVSMTGTGSSGGSSGGSGQSQNVQPVLQN